MNTLYDCGPPYFSVGTLDCMTTRMAQWPVHSLEGAKQIHRKALRKEDCHIQFLGFHPPMKLNGVWWKEVDRTSGSHRLPAQPMHSLPQNSRETLK